MIAIARAALSRRARSVSKFASQKAYQKQLTWTVAKQPKFLYYDLAADTTIRSCRHLAYLSSDPPEGLVLIIDRRFFCVLLFRQRLNTSRDNQLESIVEFVLILEEKAIS
jgi:hypothetical protein